MSKPIKLTPDLSKFLAKYCYTNDKGHIMLDLYIKWLQDKPITAVIKPRKTEEKSN